jgi:hypothetical protein
MRETIFETPVEMPSKSNSQDVLRVAMTPGEANSNHSPAMLPVNRNVKNIERPRRGHGY